MCAAARPEITAHVMRCEREALDRLQARASARGGRGAAGIAEVLDALNQARVETLLIAENFRARGRVDFQAGLLLPEGRDEGEPVDDIVEPAIEKAIEQSANAMVVRHHADLDAARRHRRGAAVLRVAFLGTGIMGAPMARNLAAAGHEVRAWNRTPAKAEGLGATVAGSPGRGGRGRRGRHHDALRRADRRGRDGRRHAGRRRQVWWQASTVGVEWIDEARRRGRSSTAR